MLSVYIIEIWMSIFFRLYKPKSIDEHKYLSCFCRGNKTIGTPPLT